MEEGSTNRKDRKRRWGVSNQVHSRMSSTSANELRSPTNLGDRDRPVFFTLLHLPYCPPRATGEPRVAEERLFQWFGPPYVIYII